MNTIKTFFFLMVLTGLLLLVGYIIGGEGGVIIALVFAIFMNFGAFWFSDKIALGMAHAHPITEQDDPELFGIVADQAARAGLPMPKVYEISSDSPNAFATGRSPRHGTVAVTTGIRRFLNREELGAVLAHEMAHVGNHDTLIMAVVASIAGAISMLAFMAQWSAIFGSMGGGRDRGGGNMIGLLVVAIQNSVLHAPPQEYWPGVPNAVLPAPSRTTEPQYPKPIPLNAWITSDGRSAPKTCRMVESGMSPNSGPRWSLVISRTLSSLRIRTPSSSPPLSSIWAKRR